MDIATLVGIILAFASVLIGMIVEGGNPASLLEPAAYIIVVPTTFAAAFASGYLQDVKLVVAGTKKAFMTKHTDSTESVGVLVKFADKARREGLLALEEPARQVDDPFLKRGVEMAIDGTDPEELREILEAEITAKRKELKVAPTFYTAAGGFAPTIGIIGTCLGLVHVLHNLTDPGSLGPAISAAFIATLLGVSTANLIYLPMAGKLKRIAEEEVSHMEVIVEGVLSIQSGANPRVLNQKLSAFLGTADNDDERAA